MPRPERIRQREAAAADAVTQDDAPANETVDNIQQQSQSDPGQADEAELVLARNVARRLGWVTKEEWKRDPAKWREADQFLEETPTQIESLKERLKRIGQVSEAAAEEARLRGLREGEERLRAAIAAGDQDAGLQSARQIAQNSGQPPQTLAWMARNPWFKARPGVRATDPATLVAIGEIQQAEERGATIEEALEAGESAVRRRFPEYFEDGAAPQREVRLSEVAKAPQVQGGSRGSAVRASKEKGWADIPPGDRNQMERGVMRRAREHGKTIDEMRDLTARNYWANV